MRAFDQGAGHPRPDGKAEEEPIAELLATTTTPPGGMRGHASRTALFRGPPGPAHRPVTQHHPALDQVAGDRAEGAAVHRARRGVVRRQPPATVLLPGRAL